MFLVRFTESQTDNEAREILKSTHNQQRAFGLGKKGIVSFFKKNI